MWVGSPWMSRYTFSASSRTCVYGPLWLRGGGECCAASAAAGPSQGSRRVCQGCHSECGSPGEFVVCCLGAVRRCLRSISMGLRGWFGEHMRQQVQKLRQTTRIHLPLLQPTCQHLTPALTQHLTPSIASTFSTHLGPYVTAPPLPPDGPPQSFVVLFCSDVASFLTATHHQHPLLRSVPFAAHPTSVQQLRFAEQYHSLTFGSLGS